jgi:SAM-dependent methyltransferase
VPQSGDEVSDKPPVGHVRFGDFDRTSAIGEYFSRGRGTSIDRLYIAAFLDRNRNDVAGRVLEIEESHYTKGYGGDRVTQSDVLDVWAANPMATITGDLTAPSTLPRDAFDCIIFTQTLQFIYDARAAVQSLHAALKPGGVLLATMPGISQIDAAWEQHWSFSRASAGRLFGDVFGPEMIKIESHGNVFAAVCMLHGVAAEELPHAKLFIQDAIYPVTITVRAVKTAIAPDPA